MAETTDNTPKTTDEVPPSARLWLDPDVARWLHLQADKHYAGDVERALNEAIRTVMLQVAEPGNPWAALQHQLRSRQRALLEESAAKPRAAEPGS